MATYPKVAVLKVRQYDNNLVHESECGDQGYNILVATILHNNKINVSKVQGHPEMVSTT